MRKSLFAVALLLLLGTGNALAQGGVERELSRPIVAFMPLLVRHADALGLTEAQRAWVGEWRATAPARRQAVEQEQLKLRQQLRANVLTGADLSDREAIAEQIGQLETQLVNMRMNCVQAVRENLTAEQYRMLTDLYRSSQAEGDCVPGTSAMCR
ncbi:hypothetical protein [Thioalkalivibrio sulfidiphilus]|uniref:Zinc resistance-associated protein n=1 Tax=Thioalkalivibrio sulfidiphilus (strain HL-EbGR7) TaxID=396588 RepID=B8GME8_THISH|nr:hypothetical protein [Thioalkalivibrio sulfidiphilus]ACL71780.1 hypothetical protein Tgr7_0688 [Thioalkalivibrio sulfidiphilus HL-EbGr7]